MDRVLKHFLITLGAASVLAAAEGPKFYGDDPIRAYPDVAIVDSAAPRKIDALYDFAFQSVQPDRRAPVASEAVNTLGEVPDSSWYTNRHQRARMPLDELRQGPGNANAPVGPYEVIGGKAEGITPGFTIRDARGRTYYVKPDPESNPEMASAADVIGSKFFYALGYNTPENYILHFRPSELTVRADKFTKRDLAIILDRVPRTRDGRLRVVASLKIDGEVLGPFKYTRTRSDDPNDVFPHDRRRDLRGLHVLAAWLNHTDAKAGNSLDVVSKKNGRSAIRHYLIDFGAMLGSDSDMAKNARYGHEYVLPRGREALKGMFSFGFRVKPWESVYYLDVKPVGRFEASLFDPETWTSNYPNPAFLSRLPEDEFWAARLVMAFTDEEIRAIVETGEYSDDHIPDGITRTLAQRRDKIGKTYFDKFLALDRFRVEANRLRFEDLLVAYKFAPARGFSYAWHRFDNATQETQTLGGESSAAMPAAFQQAADGAYFMVRINAAGDTSTRTVRVYLRKRGGDAEVVGIERS